MPLNTSRHEAVFSPDRFGNRRVDVIGVGATGSKVAELLARLGIRNIHIWDHDTVGTHNIPNQVFGLGDVGKKKVEAVAGIVRAATGTSITPHPEKVTGGTQLEGEFVFLLTDSMSSRREIWQGSLRMRPHIKLVVETRLSADNYRVYSFNPCSPIEIGQWEKTLVDPVKKNSASACGTEISVGPTAHMAAGQAVWQLIRHVQAENGSGKEAPNELIVGINPPLVLSRSFHQ